MFFPYKDETPRILTPYVTYAILVINVLVFGYQTLLPDLLSHHGFTLRYGFIPAYFWGASAETVLDFNRDILTQVYGARSWSRLGDLKLLPGLVTLFTAPFLHGGWMHIIGNMLFLYVFADNVEGALGHYRFARFYIFTAIVAGLAHAFMAPDSMLPVVGASGAISGVLGGYVVRYPQARIHVLVFFVIFFTTLRLPAKIVLGYWFLIQAINGWISLELGGDGIAWFEHIGGFAAGFSYMVWAGRSRKFP